MHRRQEQHEDAIGLRIAGLPGESEIIEKAIETVNSIMTLAEHPDDYDILKEALDEMLVFANEQEENGARPEPAGAAGVGVEAAEAAAPGAKRPRTVEPERLKRPERLNAAGAAGVGVEAAGAAAPGAKRRRGEGVGVDVAGAAGGAKKWMPPFEGLPMTPLED